MLGRKGFTQNFKHGKFGKKFGFRTEEKIAPVKVGEEYDVEISEISRRGDGIAKVKNFVIFIAGANKGDKGKIKITEVHRRCAVGKFLDKSSEKSEDTFEESDELFEEESEESEEEF